MLKRFFQHSTETETTPALLETEIDDDFIHLGPPTEPLPLAPEITKEAEILEEAPSAARALEQKQERERDSESSNDADSDSEHPAIPPLRLQSHCPPPSTACYQKLYDYSYNAGVLQGTLWGGFLNRPLALQFFGAAVLSAISTKLILLNTELNQSALIKEQLKKEMLFNALAAALATNALEFAFNDSFGFWVAPLMMITAKTAVDQTPSLSKNLVSWWNRRPANSGDHKKSDDLETPSVAAKENLLHGNRFR